jgi:hypothetical protein
MGRIKSLLVGAAGAAALAAAFAAIRHSRAAPFPGAVPPPPPSRPPEHPKVDEAPRPASEPAPPPDLDAKNSTSGSSNTYSEMSKEELYAEARRRDVPGRSKMSKEELVRALSGT